MNTQANACTCIECVGAACTCGCQSTVSVAAPASTCGCGCQQGQPCGCGPAARSYAPSSPVAILKRS
jgi:hypothetical protein